MDTGILSSVLTLCQGCRSLLHHDTACGLPQQGEMALSALIWICPVAVWYIIICRAWSTHAALCWIHKLDTDSLKIETSLTVHQSTFGNWKQGIPPINEFSHVQTRTHKILKFCFSFWEWQLSNTLAAGFLTSVSYPCGDSILKLVTGGRKKA